MSVARHAEAAEAGEHGQSATAQETQTPKTQHESLPSKRTYDKVRSKWRSVDALEVAAMPLDRRRGYAESSLRDADLCQELRLHPNSLRMSEYAGFYRRSLGFEIDLRMGALAMAPELASDENVNNLIEVGIELSEQLGVGRERDLADIDKLIKLHDILALEALWMARGALAEQEKVAAKVMLGDSIADSMREIVSLAKRIEKVASYDESVLGQPSGILAEFMLVTWERLNLYMMSHGDIDVLARVFVRGSLDREDKMASSPNRSIDAVIMNLDRHYIRPQQYKSSSRSTREYDKAIEVVHIPDWASVRDNIQDVARQFDIILSPHSTGPAKEKAREALNAYFERPRVAKVTS